MNQPRFLAVLVLFSSLSFIACGKSLSSAGSPDGAGGNGSQQTPLTDSGFDLKAQAEFYKQRYGLTNPYDKLVDNRGNGYENLYGVRNLRVVLHGIYYRGGANNVYNKYLVRDNENPLQNAALDNLCEEGFSGAMYLYSTNFATARKATNCRNIANEDQTLSYVTMDAFSVNKESAILSQIFDRIKGKIPGLLYAHCWNGWHASGVVAALSLQQFCGWTPAEAEAYWIRNTDGDSNYPDHKQQIRSFRIIDSLRITAEEAALICPSK